MKVSFHAKERFQERTGCKNSERAEKSLLKIAARAKPAFAYRCPSGTIKLLTADHFVSDGWVLVIKNEKIITCFMANKEQCL